MNRFVSLLMMLLMLFPALTMAKSSKKKPKWVDSPKSVYPESMYLSAVGSGNSRTDAENNAAANLAKIFRSEISASTSYQERYREIVSPKKTDTSTETKTQKNVQVKTSQNLLNVEIGQTWTEPKTFRVYAVAYIHRLKTADILEQQIEENSQRIRNYLQEVAQTTDVWKLYSLYNVASVINMNSEELLSQLAIISPDTKELIQLGYNPDELKLNLGSWAKAVNFHIEVLGEGDEESFKKIHSMIAEVVTGNGWTVSDVNAALLEANVILEEVELNQPQKFCRYSISINIYNLGGNLMLSLSDSKREGHINMHEAKARVLRALNAKIKTEIPKQLNQYFDSLVITKKQ